MGAVTSNSLKDLKYTRALKYRDGEKQPLINRDIEGKAIQYGIVMAFVNLSILILTTLAFPGVSWLFNFHLRPIAMMSFPGFLLLSGILASSANKRLTEYGYRQLGYTASVERLGRVKLRNSEEKVSSVKEAKKYLFQGAYLLSLATSIALYILGKISILIASSGATFHFTNKALINTGAIMGLVILATVILISLATKSIRNSN